MTDLLGRYSIGKRGQRFRRLVKSHVTGETEWQHCEVNQFVSSDIYDVLSPWIEYTGIYDKNENEICEGDILEVSIFTPKEERRTDVVKWGTGAYTAVGLYEIERRKVVVIGNIFENPELLKNK